MKRKFKNGRKWRPRHGDWLRQRGRKGETEQMYRFNNDPRVLREFAAMRYWMDPKRDEEFAEAFRIEDKP